jgi:integrase
MTITKLLSLVMDRLGHSSLEVTERYINYRKRLKSAHAIQENWEEWVDSLIQKTMGGTNG